MPPAYKKTITAENYDVFRDQVPSSGLFEMTDCEVEIWCPQESDVKEVQRMVKLLESMVHVTDVRIGTTIEELNSEKYRIVITEASPVGRKKFNREQ